MAFVPVPGSRRGPSVRAGHDPAGEEEYTAVSTPADLLAIAQAPDGRYRLTANIDMTGVEWIPIPFPDPGRGRLHHRQPVRPSNRLGHGGDRGR